MADIELRRTALLWMSRAFVWAIAAASFLAIWGSSGAAEGEVEGRLSVSKGPFLVGEPIMVTVELVNNSDRVVAGREPSFANEDAVRLVIEGAGGDTLKYTGEHTAYFSYNSYGLQPGESLSTRMDIIPYYYIPKPGKYKAYAICRLEQPEKEIRSNEVEFQVVNASGGFCRIIPVEPIAPKAPKSPVLAWEVFTHEREGSVRVYARMLTATPGPLRFAELGVTVSEDDIVCLVDTKWTLHVLHGIAEPEQTYAYDRVPLLKEVERVGLYKPQKGVKPSLAITVHVEGAERIQSPE